MYRAECPTCKTSYPIKPETRGGDQLVMVCSVCKTTFYVTKRAGSFMFPRVELRKSGTP
jgi:predicted Zn finger-like uncharacterized protein